MFAHLTFKWGCLPPAWLAAGGDGGQKYEPTSRVTTVSRPSPKRVPPPILNVHLLLS